MVPNQFIVNDPALTFGELQLWRLFLCPLITTSFFFDILFIMPIYLCFFGYIKEYHSGTLSAYIYFNMLSKCTFDMLNMLFFRYDNPVA